ncbi:MAG: adenylosuccinate synthetase [Nitrososphaeraceae archaeon]|jgi:adenylosuccinate synthase|nr:adenylosuccinate synthetase [Nitrososphaeraceae archaeon]MDW0174906.1 adenylosuccinate synthetase [Nitrososphaeraceae archaeon]MDW0178643.1 adenylosuccinate synthetase [Nitrososphaeraceae archaeon]MDW0182581.1 adenylosuccinate synthetase [Nitrososphaeraceae archaeon]MDW0183722.1 adenylosuccinate synthetase [Nitrososphaeraceae archaeon]
MTCNVIVGGFYGDEGKGKIIAYLSLKDNPKIAVRGGVGANAGHTFVHNNQTYKVRMLPSAVLNPETQLLIGAGVLITPEVLIDESRKYNAENRTIIDNHCGIIDESHIKRDKENSHLKNTIGTTGTGTGPANSDRALRILNLAKNVDSLKKYLGNVSDIVNESIDKSQSVLIEGTQGTFLSLYHGDYPFVTSKDVTASGICSDVGIGPKKVDDVILVFKAYVTRVGGGPLENEISPDEAAKLGWVEYGSVTGRQRRASPFNLELAKKSIKINSATQLAVTKLDVVFPECAGLTEYSKLTSKPRQFIENIEANLGVKVVLIGTGAEINQIIDRR